jgi:hypothetical protein
VKCGSRSSDKSASSASGKPDIAEEANERRVEPKFDLHGDWRPEHRPLNLPDGELIERTNDRLQIRLWNNVEHLKPGVAKQEGQGDCGGLGDTDRDVLKVLEECHSVEGYLKKILFDEPF